jgi:hypothetical protein
LSECASGFCQTSSSAPSFLTSLFVSCLVLGSLFAGIYYMFVRTIMLSKKKSRGLLKEGQTSYVSL